MQTRIYAPTGVPSSSNITPIGASSILEAILVQGDGKYTSSTFGVSTATNFRAYFTFDRAIPFGASIPSFIITMRAAKTMGNGVFQFRQIPVTGSGPAFINVSPSSDFLAEPAAFVPLFEQPTDATWQLYTSTFTITDSFPTNAAGFLSSFLGIIRSGTPSASSLVPGDGVFTDYISLTVNFVLPTPTPHTPVLLTSWTNRLDVSAQISLVEDGQTPEYPVTYYWEWTDFDPTLSTPKIIYTSSTQTLDDGNSQVKGGIPVEITLPEDFSYTDRSKQLVAGKTYWVRITALNADHTEVSDWAEFTTLSKDHVVI